MTQSVLRSRKNLTMKLEVGHHSNQVQMVLFLHCSHSLLARAQFRLINFHCPRLSRRIAQCRLTATRKSEYLPNARKFICCRG